MLRARNVCERRLTIQNYDTLMGLLMALVKVLNIRTLLVCRTACALSERYGASLAAPQNLFIQKSQY